MATEKVILKISTADLNSLVSKEIGVQSSADSDLGFKAWGGKAADGTLTIWLAKDQNIRCKDVVIAQGSALYLCASGSDKTSAGTLKVAIGAGGEYEVTTI